MALGLAHQKAGCRIRNWAWRNRSVLSSLGISAMAITADVQASRASAAEPAWPAEPYRYTVIEQDLTSVLQEFGHNTALRVEISADVHGKVRGPWPVLAPREFLDEVCRTYGLEWYFDGFKLYVTTGKENASRLISRGGVTWERLEASLRELEVLDDRFALRAVTHSDLVLVFGPPQYLTLVERSIVALKEALHPRRDQPLVVTVYRGDQVASVKLEGMQGSVP
jgi:type III secretion protein C